MKVFILTEGGRKIGFGHVTRCLSIYQAFEEKKITPRIIVNGDEAVESILDGMEHEVFNWIEEEERLLDMLKGADAAIVDSYLAGIELYRKISASVIAPAYIDDNNRLEYPDGIIINGTIYADRYFPSRKKGMTYLLGSSYIPLRKAFWEVSEKKINERIESAVITFGGNDPENMTPGVLRLLAERYPELTKKVIIGRGFANVKEIEAVKDRMTEMIYYPEAEQMREVLLSSDIAISAGGQTVYELARTGTPAIAVAVANNQYKNVEGWKDAGFAEDAGKWDDADLLNRIEAAFLRLRDKEVRSKRSAAGRKCVDGKGALRIRDFLIKGRSLPKADIQLIPVSENDCEDILLWRNDPLVRQHSFDTRIIAIDEHRKWFCERLKDRGTRMYIGKRGEDRIGVIRFETKDDSVDVSVYLRPGFAGKGLGTELIKAGTQQAESELGGVLPILARIKKENRASQKAFEKAGYRLRGENEGICTYKKEKR